MTLRTCTRWWLECLGLCAGAQVQQSPFWTLWCARGPAHAHVDPTGGDLNPAGGRLGGLPTMPPI